MAKITKEELSTFSNELEKLKEISKLLCVDINLAAQILILMRINK